MEKTMWIGLLEIEQKEEIRTKLDASMMNEFPDEIERTMIIDEGMDGRLCDLEAAIDIHCLELTKIE